MFSGPRILGADELPDRSRIASAPRKKLPSDDLLARPEAYHDLAQVAGRTLGEAPIAVPQWHVGDGALADGLDRAAGHERHLPPLAFEADAHEHAEPKRHAGVQHLDAHLGRAGCRVHSRIDIGDASA